MRIRDLLRRYLTQEGFEVIADGALHELTDQVGFPGTRPAPDEHLGAAGVGRERRQDVSREIAQVTAALRDRGKEHDGGGDGIVWQRRRVRLVVIVVEVLHQPVDLVAHCRSRVSRPL